MIVTGHTCHYSILYSEVMPLKLLDNEYIKTIQINWLATVSLIPVLLWRKELFRDFLGTMREMRDLGDTLACKGPFTTVLIDYSACGNGVCWESSKLLFEYLFNIVESISMEMSIWANCQCQSCYVIILCCDVMHLDRTIHNYHPYPYYTVWCHCLHVYLWLWRQSN